MADLFSFCKPLAVILALQLIVRPGQSQTVCTYRVPVPDLDICDASGGIEDNTNAGVYEMKGKISGIQEYQEDNFKLLDQQINSFANERENMDTGISDIGGELLVLKRTLESIQTAQASIYGNNSKTIFSGRNKRALSSNTILLRDLNTAKQSFQLSIAALQVKLQNLAQQASNQQQQITASHRRYQSRLTQNQHNLATTESQFTTIAQTVQQLGLFASTPSSSSVSPTSSTTGTAQLSQDVTDLIVDGRTAEQVAQRQVDTLDQQLQTMNTIERNIQADIKTGKTSFNNTMARLANVTQQTLATTTAERMFGDVVGDIVTNGTLEVANARKLLPNASNTLSQLGQDVLNEIVKATTLSQEITSVKKNVNGVQSLVAYSQGLSRGQLNDLLNLRVRMMDNIRVLQYAFGVTTNPP